MNTIDRPDFISDEHLEYLDDLRESGETNMFGARPYLMREFPELDKDQAGKVLSYWMATFSDRHPEPEADSPAPRRVGQ
jgi:hypothetical protein